MQQIPRFILCSCTLFLGLTTLSYNGSLTAGTSLVEPFPPGHVETYKLDTDGRAYLEELVRYHKIGEAPAYPTFEVALGRNMVLIIDLYNNID